MGSFIANSFLPTGARTVSFLSMILQMQFHVCNLRVVYCAVYLFILISLSNVTYVVHNSISSIKGKGEVHPCTGTEALYRPYGP